MPLLAAAIPAAEAAAATAAAAAAATASTAATAATAVPLAAAATAVPLAAAGTTAATLGPVAAGAGDWLSALYAADALGSGAAGVGATGAATAGSSALAAKDLATGGYPPPSMYSNADQLNSLPGSDGNIQYQPNQPTASPLPSIKSADTVAQGAQSIDPSTIMSAFKKSLKDVPDSAKSWFDKNEKMINTGMAAFTSGLSALKPTPKQSSAYPVQLGTANAMQYTPNIPAKNSSGFSPLLLQALMAGRR